MASTPSRGAGASTPSQALVASTPSQALVASSPVGAGGVDAQSGAGDVNTAAAATCATAAAAAASTTPAGTFGEKCIGGILAAAHSGQPTCSALAQHKIEAAELFERDMDDLHSIILNTVDVSEDNAPPGCQSESLGVRHL